MLLCHRLEKKNLFNLQTFVYCTFYVNCNNCTTINVCLCVWLKWDWLKIGHTSNHVGYCLRYALFPRRDGIKMKEG